MLLSWEHIRSWCLLTRAYHNTYHKIHPISIVYPRSHLFLGSCTNLDDHTTSTSLTALSAMMDVSIHPNHLHTPSCLTLETGLPSQITNPPTSPSVSGSTRIPKAGLHGYNCSGDKPLQSTNSFAFSHVYRLWESNSHGDVDLYLNTYFSWAWCQNVNTTR
jgi:hypothetical protein